MIVETTGAFMLVDINGAQEIAAFQPTEVEETAFVRWALEEGLLRDTGVKAKPAELNDDAPTSGRASKAK